MLLAKEEYDPYDGVGRPSGPLDPEIGAKGLGVAGNVPVRALCRPRKGASPALAPTELVPAAPWALVPAGGAPKELVPWLHRSEQLFSGRSAP